jgi:hypothetical protein
MTLLLPSNGQSPGAMVTTEDDRILLRQGRGLQDRFFWTVVNRDWR